jgi:hypothetical protein
MEHDTETLALALKRGDLAAIAEALAAGVDPNRPEPYSGRTALDLLMEQPGADGQGPEGDRVDQAMALLGPYIKPQALARALTRALSSQGNVDILMRWATPGAAELRVQDHNTLFVAARKGNLPAMDWLVDRGMDLQDVDLDDLLIKVLGLDGEARRVETLAWLLDAGASLQAQDKRGKGVLELAQSGAELDLLLARGAQMPPGSQNNILMDAWQRRLDETCVQVLLDAGVLLEHGPSLEDIEQAAPTHPMVKALKAAWWRRQLLNEAPAEQQSDKPARPKQKF